MTPCQENRRLETRLPGGDAVDATVANDDHPLRDVQVLDVSSVGIGLMSTTCVEPGTRLHITPRAESAGVLHVQTVRRATHPNGTHTIGCHLIEGRVPASLLYCF